MYNPGDVSSSILARVSHESIRTEPFPYLVVDNVLPAGLAQELASSYPPLSVLMKGKPPLNNRRFDYSIADIRAAQSGVSEGWIATLEMIAGKAFLADIFRLFGPEIAQVYPKLSSQFAQGMLRKGIKNVDDFDRADILLDAHISGNSPVVSRSTSVRRQHLDVPQKLYAGLLYLRDPADDSTGGEFVIYRGKKDTIPLYGLYPLARDMEEVVKVPYAFNRLVLFLNTPRAYHGVTPRSLTPFVRKFINLYAEVPYPLFDVEHSQAPRALQALHGYYRRIFEPKG